MKKPDDIVMVCICDYAGQVKGKGFRGKDLKSRLRSGVGLAPSNLMITTFGQIVDTPWGPRGELIMMPAPETEVTVEHGPDRPRERFLLASLLDLDGEPWSCCPRSWLKKGLDALEAETGLRLNSAFEHEFHYTGATPRLGDAYSLDAMRLQGAFAQRLMQALDENGIDPEMVLPEYGPQQFEVTCRPALGLKSADDAVRLREITRSVARALGQKATFSPVMGAGAVGNGVHVHFSLEDKNGKPQTFDPERPHRIGEAAAHFTAGILSAMPALVALTAPSAVSYERLQPNRWSASYNNLADKDREAGVRICPLSKLPGTDARKSFNLEYRAADAAANPYLTLGALVWAGLQGIRDRLPLPAATEGDPGQLPEEERRKRGLSRLPASLGAALDEFAADKRIADWMGADFVNAYLTHKRSELKLVKDLDLNEQIKRYVEVY
ncbi:glutamine synthetase family protein [Taklimakanibacter deserti]|uniref:glutamine synthetase family protein n=1 Tax=Taklimakanibacter deserti TaxID=2267839 RepID=UPI000E652E3F